jgi:capsular polysaccharide transport system ATP-binding protein
MLVLKEIYKSYSLEKNETLNVLKGINLTVKKGEKIAILGRNGAGKSTLIRIIGGIEFPDQGKIQSTMSVSWPVGISGGMQGSLSGIDNINFLCRIYGSNRNKVIEFVDNFAELGNFLTQPVKTYSSGMRGRLNFALSMAFNFDCLLVDEGLVAGDSRFTERCINAIDSKKDCAFIMVAHSEESIRRFCDKAYLLENGRLKNFDTLDEAFKYYNSY